MIQLEHCVDGYLPYFEQILPLKSPGVEKLLTPQSRMELSAIIRPLIPEVIAPEYYPAEKILSIKYIKQTSNRTQMGNSRDTYFMHCLFIPLNIIVQMQACFPIEFDGENLKINIHSLIDVFGKYIIRDPNQVTGPLKPIMVKE
jgi:hypothetical protein